MTVKKSDAASGNKAMNTNTMTSLDVREQMMASSETSMPSTWTFSHLAGVMGLVLADNPENKSKC